MFDDFDTQIQSDELIPAFWNEYDVDCDDGTIGDSIWAPKFGN